jgi:hypothetical protein
MGQMEGIPKSPILRLRSVESQGPVLSGEERISATGLKETPQVRGVG